MSARIVAVINQKGGAGKTTTCVNLAHALSRLGYRVLTIDLDPQSHLGIALGQTSRTKPGIDQVLLGLSSIETQTLSVRENLNLIVAGPKLQELEQLSDGLSHRGDLLKSALSTCNDQDFIFIDCPPSSGILVANALFAAEELLIPMTSDYMALQGLSHLMGTIKKYETALHKKYKIKLVMSRYIPTRRLSHDVLETIKKYFPKQILKTPIRETASLAESPSFGKTIFEYRPGWRSAKDFSSLANDFINERVM